MAGHKFNPINLKRLDNPQRRAILPPESVLQDIGLKPGQLWADIGCGAGYFTIPMVEFGAKVYALDISEDMLAELRRRLSEQLVQRVEIKQSAESSLPLPDASVDGALMALVAHELDNPQKLFLELNRVLKPYGCLVIIEWVKAPTEMGPPVSQRLEPEQIDGWAFEAGLARGRSWDWSGVFIGLEYRKSIDNRKA